jgi:C-terminal processing protease CtpA/Prc
VLAIVLLQNLLSFSDTINIEYESDNGIKIIRFVSDDFKTPKYSIKKVQKEKPFNLTIYQQDAIAVLELNTFQTDKLETKNGEFEKALTKLIDSVIRSNVKHFFIDITSNGGGSTEYVYQLLDFLVNDSTNFYLNEIILKASPRMKRLFLLEHRIRLLFSKKYRKDKDSEERKIAKTIKKWNFAQIKSHWQPSNSKNIYENNIYLIQSGSSFSAAVNLASFVKTYKTATVIGEEIGGKTSGYINSQEFTMKNSKMNFTCSWMFFEEAANIEKNRGVLPDIAYKIENPTKSFTLEQLKEMLQLVEQYKTQTK